MLLLVGLAATAVAALGLIWLTLRRPAAARFPAYGWCALAALAGLELLLVLRTPAVAEFFTALAWSCYIPLVDAAVYRLRGDSLLHAPRQLLAMAALSVPAWLIFEAYNLRLRNWEYVGVPHHFADFALGATWAFATIFPGIFETADLIHSAWAAGLRWRPWKPAAPMVEAGVRASGTRGKAALGPAPSHAWPWMLLGAGLLLAPLVAPAGAAPYLFGLVWAGFIFFLDPLNRALGWPSLLADLEQGRPGRFVALLLAGGACGFFWEFWNFWASARWRYVFPILHRWRIFEMPVPGFLGFPPFALECFALYIFLAHALLPPHLRAPLLRPYGSLNARGTQEDICPRAPI